RSGCKEGILNLGGCLSTIRRDGAPENALRTKNRHRMAFRQQHVNSVTRRIESEGVRAGLGFQDEERSPGLGVEDFDAPRIADRDVKPLEFGIEKHDIGGSA